MNRHAEQLVSVVFRLPRAKLERLRKLSSETRIRQSEFLREAIGNLITKHAAALLNCTRCNGLEDINASGLCSSCALRQLQWEHSQLRCGCGRSYTWAEYLALPVPLRGSQQETTDDHGAPMFLEVRNCSCLSTMARHVGAFPEGWAP